MHFHDLILKLSAAASDKAYQLLAHGRWFSPDTPASSTTKTGRHDIAEILLKVASRHQKSNQINLNVDAVSPSTIANIHFTLSRFDSKIIRFYTFSIRVVSLTNVKNDTWSSKINRKNNELEYNLYMFEPCKKLENNFIAMPQFESCYNINVFTKLTSYVPWLVPRHKEQINTNLSQWNFYLGDVITIKSMIFFIFNLF